MQSMTGCGRSCMEQDGLEITAELKSVNHRFLDISCRLPRNISFLEDVVRSELSRNVARGHVEVFLNLRSTGSGEGRVTVDEALASAYTDAARKLSEATGVANDFTVKTLMRMDGVLTVGDPEIDPEAASGLCRMVMQDAVSQLKTMRAREGAAMREDLSVHLAAVAAIREKILERAPGVIDDYRKKLTQRISQLMNEAPDPTRIAQEVALMADRCAIDEELARLESHIRQMTVYLDTDKPDGIGKQMDFLIQEMNREANTIGSKANDAEIAQQVVLLKNEIEKLREQVQNIE